MAGSNMKVFIYSNPPSYTINIESIARLYIIWTNAVQYRTVLSIVGTGNVPARV